MFRWRSLDVNATISTGTGYVAVTAGRNFAGGLSGGAASAARVAAGYDVTASMNVGTLYSLTAGHDITANMTASDHIGTISAAPPERECVLAW